MVPLIDPIADFFDDVRRLAKTATARELETEAGRAVPDDLARALGDIGVFRLFVPKSLGGREVDPMTACAVVEELSRADGSTGWTAMILNTTFFSCWLDPAVTSEMLAADPQLGMAGLYTPVGRAEPAGGGAVRLTGRYPFNSGCLHAAWFCEGALVADPAGGEPMWRFLFLPARDVEILDTWRTAGLRGTGSHDVVVDGALVPPERMANPFFDRAPHPEPHFRWSFLALIAALISGFPLGVARRALDEFVALAGHKGRGGGPPLATEQVTQLAVARSESALRAARAWVMDSLAAAWDTAVAGDEISREQRIDIRLAASNAMRTAVEVVDATFGLAGGGALYDENPLQRCWRDLHAGSSHMFFSDNNVARVGQALLGQPTEEWRI